MRASGLTSAADWEGSPGWGCVTGAPELQLRTLDLRTRRSIRDTGRVAMEPVGLAETRLSSRLREHSSPGLAALGHPGQGGRGRGQRSQSAMVPSRAANRRGPRAAQPSGSCSPRRLLSFYAG